MKKVLLAIAVIALIGCASCSKAKICHCYYDYTTVTGSSGSQDLGQRIINKDKTSCSDLEDKTNFNFDFGLWGSGQVRCEEE